MSTHTILTLDYVKYFLKEEGIMYDKCVQQTNIEANSYCYRQHPTCTFEFSLKGIIIAKYYENIRKLILIEGG